MLKPCRVYKQYSKHCNRNIGEIFPQLPALVSERKFHSHAKAKINVPQIEKYPQNGNIIYNCF
jgi:hypothetical protein